jgi:small subunit ribosomal protein S8
MMTSTDPIADMLTRIRNGASVGKKEVSMPHSTIKENILKVLADRKIISSFKTVEGEKPTHKNLLVVINKEQSTPNFTEIKRVSTPGRRVYVGAGDIPKVKQGRGFVVLSTSKGLMTGLQAQTQKLGGEVICQVY